jgi:adenosine kinase
VIVETIVVTQGEKGWLIHTNDQEINIPPAIPNLVAEPTGAGDAYRAGLIAGMMRDYPWEVCGRLGAMTAVYVLEQHGTQRHTYTRRQLVERYRKIFGDAKELDDFVNDPEAE